MGLKHFNRAAEKRVQGQLRDVLQTLEIFAYLSMIEALIAAIF